ncbi:unnamed protein product [Triticum turgidum subsp. durum]|uniref:Uncharacterized protein n=1 Tax=Triticum turgidum subsp. durum TaxID=4567 RepID=A0A9R0R3E0_TRITD|nr:unnamed protein product [Triticum turgidum subsp. durum]
MMGDDKAPRSLSPMGGRDRDRELLIPVSAGGGGGSVPRAGDDDDDLDRTVASPSASAALSSTGREAFHKVVRSWASKKFMTGCVILFPIAITFYFTWWFIHFVDGFFSPIYAQLGINIFVLASSLLLLSYFSLGSSCHLGLEHLFLALVNGSSSACHLCATSTMHPSKLVLLYRQIKTNRHSRRQSSYDILVLGNMHLDSLPHQSRSRAILVKRTFTVSMCRPTISTLVISSW